MRRFGLPGVVALAGLVACSRFGTSDDTSETPEKPDASGTSTSSSSSGGVASSSSSGSGDAGASFCKAHLDAKLCADFEDGEPTTALSPAGKTGYKREIGFANQRHALHVTAQNVPKNGSWGQTEGAFRVELDAETLASAHLELEVLVEHTEVQFARIAGFDYVLSDKPGLHLTVETGINRVFAMAEKFVPRMDGTWTHITFDAVHTGDNLIASVQAGGESIDGAKISVKDNGTLVFGFGLWDVSEDGDKTLSVWIDDVLLTTK